MGFRHRFVKGHAVEFIRDHLHQCGFSNTDVPRHCDKFLHHAPQKNRVQALIGLSIASGLPLNRQETGLHPYFGFPSSHKKN